MAEFKDFIAIVESKLGNTITRQSWSATIERIVEKNPKSIKIDVRFFSQNYSFNQELKLVERHFDGEVKFNNEIVKFLKRLNDFTQTMSEITVQNSPSIITKWKVYVSDKIDVNPTYTIITYTYAQRVGQEIMSFEKDAHFTAQSFISKGAINADLNYKLELLNTPIDVNYYKNLING